MYVKVNLPGYYIVENGVPVKVTKEEYDNYIKTHDMSYLALGDNEIK